MSNVYTRNRKVTGYEYYDVCTELLIELRRVTCNSNIFPKRCLYTDVVPLIVLFKKMRSNIEEAYSRFPTDEHNLAIRKEYIQRAIDAGEDLNGMIQDIVYTIDTVTPERMEKTGQLLQQELGLLRGLKRNAKVQRNKK